MIFKKKLSLVFLIGFLSLSADNSENDVNSAQLTWNFTQALDEAAKQYALQDYNEAMEFILERGDIQRVEGPNGEVGYIAYVKPHGSLRRILMGCKRLTDGNVECSMRDFVRSLDDILNSHLEFDATLMHTVKDKQVFEKLEQAYQQSQNNDK